jgi:drug/metabolite transporter (DMT)-like permease
LFASWPSHLRAIFLALFVTFLWSTSWVLIKLGLRDIPPLTYAGLRYFLAFLCLLPFALRSSYHRITLSTLPPRRYSILALYGLLVITVTQGAQFLGLKYLPAITVSLLFNFTPIVVALLSMLILTERPSARQWLGVGFYLAGILLYFYPVSLPEAQALGILIVVTGAITNGLSSIMGRGINRRGDLSPLLVTTISMGIGSVALLAIGIIAQGIPILTPTNWLFVVWLAVVNTALAFPLWNHTLRTLSAIESSIINSTMLVQIALLAFLFLGESLDVQEVAGMALVALGTLAVQLRGRVKRKA